MEIRLSGLGKKFNRNWLFTDFSYSFHSGSRYAITGPNGSGKSTFLQIISGFQLPSSGTVEWYNKNNPVPPENWFEYCSLAAPYMELVDDFTLEEQIEFHFRFKPVRNNLKTSEIIEIGYFSDSYGKSIRHFSSGMKQRLKLLLALYSQTDVLFLDEPTTNMDQKGLNWYRETILGLEIPLLIVASNQHQEYEFCNEEINISKYKKSHK